MELKEIINRKIIDIWVWYKPEPYGLDEAEVFLQIDNDLLIDIPYSFTEEVWVKQMDKKVESLFLDERWKNLKNKVIIDFMHFEDSLDKGFLLLDNGYIITETTMAPHGTGLAGLNMYDSLEKIEERFGKDYKRLLVDR